VCLVLAVGCATALWFVSTQEVDPAASEPGAFGLFLWVYTVAAMAAAVVLCLVAEVVVRLVRRRNRVAA
jgi:hypothetical protein